jgi:type I restriction enzyme M protein
MAKGNNQKPANGSALDFEAQFWAAADKMRGHMDASEYNGARPEGLCLGLIFLKYISDAFEEKREQLRFGFSDPKSEWFIKDEPQRAEAAENRDFFSLSASIGFLRSREREKVAQPDEGRVGRTIQWERAGVRCRIPQLPPEARWHTIKAKAKSPEIGKVIDDAMGAIERESDVAQASSPAGSGGVPAASRNTGRGRPANPQPGTAALHFKDVLGRVYEYEKFASAEGTLQSAKTICGNRRMKRGFSLSASNGERAGVRCRNFGMNRRGVQNFRGQRWPCASTTTWKLARMNLAIRGIDANLGPRNADSFRQDLHPDLKADFILAKPFPVN